MAFFLLRHSLPSSQRLVAFESVAPPYRFGVFYFPGVISMGSPMGSTWIQLLSPSAKLVTEGQITPLLISLLRHVRMELVH